MSTVEKRSSVTVCCVPGTSALRNPEMGDLHYLTVVRTALLLLLFVPAARGATDAELRVANAVIDWHVEHARNFWENEVRPDSQTMAGTGRHTGRLVALETTIVPRVRHGYLHEQRPPGDDARLERIESTPLFRQYAQLRGGDAIEALHRRRDILVVPGSRLPGFKRTVEDVDPERFYERYRRARGLLLLSAPAVSADGGDALVYGELMMVFSQTGRLFHLKKRAGRWVVNWSVEMLSVPGC